MVGIGLIGSKNDLLGCRIRHVRIRRNLERGDSGISRQIGVVNHKPSIGGVIRIEREPQESLLAAGNELRAEVEKRRGQQCAVFDDPDAAGLFHNEKPTQISGRCR
jgi:hypothetical protein